MRTRAAQRRSTGRAGAGGSGGGGAARESCRCGGGGRRGRGRRGDAQAVDRAAWTCMHPHAHAHAHALKDSAVEYKERDTERESHKQRSTRSRTRTHLRTRRSGEGGTIEARRPHSDLRASRSCRKHRSRLNACARVRGCADRSAQRWHLSAEVEEERAPRRCAPEGPCAAHAAALLQPRAPVLSCRPAPCALHSRRGARTRRNAGHHRRASGTARTRSSVHQR